MTIIERSLLFILDLFISNQMKSFHQYKLKIILFSLFNINIRVDQTKKIVFNCVAKQKKFQLH